MNYTWASATHVGHIREANEDAVFPRDDGHLQGPVVVAVADGMGGHVAGEVAARTAIEAAVATEQDVTAAARVRLANDAVIAAVEADPTLFGMGTTMTLGIFHEDGRLELAHVGDSRAYLYREGEIEQLTTDHTLVAEMVARGQLTPSQALTHPRRNLLTRVVGMTRIGVDTRDVELTVGDRVLLCSDGLTGMVSDAEIARILIDSATPSEAAWTLVEAANAAGGVDNTTVAVVDVNP